MPLHKIVFRVDFKPVYRIVDNPGEIMATLSALADEHNFKDFWVSLTEDVRKHLVVATHRHDRRTCDFNVEPTAISFELQDAEGIEPEGSQKNEIVMRLLRLCDEVTAKYDLYTFKRIGLRFTYVGHIKGSSSAVLASLHPTGKLAGAGQIESVIGKISDVGIRCDGKDKDGIEYHLAYGPFFPKEDGKKHFNNLMTDKFEAELDAGSFDFVSDLDLYEADVSTGKVLPSRYLIPFFRKHIAHIKQAERELREL